jgi:hypothetical protein
VQVVAGGWLSAMQRRTSPAPPRLGPPRRRHSVAQPRKASQAVSRRFERCVTSIAFEDHATIDDAQSVVPAQPEAWSTAARCHGSIARSSTAALRRTASRPGAIQKSRQQRVPCERLVHPGDSRGGPGKRVSYTRFSKQRGLGFGRPFQHRILSRMFPRLSPTNMHQPLKRLRTSKPVNSKITRIIRGRPACRASRHLSVCRVGHYSWGTS